MAVASEFITRLRYRFQDSTDQSYSENDMIAYFNEGARYFAVSTGCIQDIDTIDTDGSNYRYSLGSLTKPVNIYQVDFNNSKLDFAPLFEVDGWGSTAGTPTAFSLWSESSAKSVITDLIPPNASGTSAFRIYYTRTPVELTANDSTIDFPDQWLGAIESFVEHRILSSQRDEGANARAYQEFENQRLAAAAINEAYLKGGYAV